jgi:membrane fusion protein, multidrug efflux system
MWDKGNIRTHGKLALAAAAALLLAGCPGEKAKAPASAPPPPKVSVAKPVVKQITEWDDFTGRFAAVDSVDVRARVSGYVDKVNFDEGSLVKAGDLLFTVDPRPYQAVVDEATANLDVANTQYDFASKELSRAESLVERGNISRSALDERRQQYASAQAQIEGAKAALRRAKLDLEFTQVRAPIAGRVSNKQVSIGNLVEADKTVLTNIVSIDPMQFYFDIDEQSYLAYARTTLDGNGVASMVASVEVRVTLPDESDGGRKGHLDFIDNRIDDATGTMRARAVFPNTDGLLQPGLFGRISIPGSPPHEGVLIPDEAISSDQDRRIVYVLDDKNAVTAQVVRPGPRIDGYRVIRKGLTGSERIVIDGLMRVRPGVTVEPQLVELPPVRK